MANKWNAEELENISTGFTKKILENELSKIPKLSGEDIIHVSDFPQINYFVLREVFISWEAETAKFKSPYFDFENEDVKKSFAQFRNTLSKNILISKENYGQLLKVATQKTLNLYLSPENFFISDFRNLPDFKLTKDWLNKNLVFFKDYRWVLESLGEKFSDKDEWFYANQALDDVKSILAERKEDFEAEVSKIAELAGYVKPKVEPEIKELPIIENESSFFERLVANPPQKRKEESQNVESSFEKIVMNLPKTEIEPKANPVISSFEKLAEPAEVVAETSVIAEAKVSGVKSFFDNSPTLNDKLSSTEGNSLSDMQMRSKIESMKGSMTLNQRFTFLNSLFSADLLTFDNALVEVDRCNSYSEAENFLEHNFSQKFNWNKDQEDYQEFMNLVKRRFN